MNTTTATVVRRAGGKGMAALVRAMYRLEGRSPRRETAPDAARAVFAPRDADSTSEDVYALGHSGTDVIVGGWVYPTQPGQTETPFSVARLGNHVNRLDGVALGARTARVGADGTVRFSAPGPIERVALRWDQAYGGRDAETEALLRRDIVGYADLLDATDVPTLCDDRRNPGGRGFCMMPPETGARTVALPTLEWRDVRLQPKGFLLADPDAWCLQVRPCCTEAVQPVWFPRAGAMGLCELPAAYVRRMTEAERAGIDPAYFADGPATVAIRGPHPSFFRVATAALQWSELLPGEAVRLSGMRPGGAERVVTLPAAPVMGAAGWTSVGRAAVVEIDAEEGTMEVLWVAEDPSGQDDHSAGFARWQEG